MTPTGAKNDRHWLTNYYLRGALALVAIVIALVAGLGNGAPLLIGIVVWGALWLAAKVREGYAAGDVSQR